MASPQRLPSGDLNMIIYKIQNKNNCNEIYIGKTKNLKNRIYQHKSRAKQHCDKKVYKWINSIGFDNIEFIIECICDDKDSALIERETVKKYEELGYTLYNDQLTKLFNPSNTRFNDRHSVYELYLNSSLSINEVADKFSISESLVKKIIKEYNYSKPHGKLHKYYKEIQQQLISGCSIRSLAKKYNVSKNSIANINTGITCFDENLDYPLNKYVRDNIIKNSWFKSKV